MRTYDFPFSAIVGNDDIKLGLIVNAIDSRIGGLLITGPKGIAKSTMVRSLSSVLPEIKAVKGCRFHCDPDGELCDECIEKQKKGKLETEEMKIRIVNLPNSTTLDRVVGSLDISHAIKGESVLREGLIGEANRGILYIDEVNLLDDSIVDSILDAAASGVNIVEREGVSYIHPARFILVGTMNPEEGELRPQLLDRFGISVEGRMPESPEILLQISGRVEEFDANKSEFISKFEDDDIKIKSRIMKARDILPYVTIRREFLMFIADTVLKNSLSNRAMISSVKTAKAIAAYNGRKDVNEEDLKKALEFALNHRIKEKGNSKPDYDYNDPDNKQNNEDKENMNSKQKDQDNQSNNDNKSGNGVGADKDKQDKNSKKDQITKIQVKTENSMETRTSGRSGIARQYKHRGKKSGNHIDMRSSLLNTWTSGFTEINSSTVVLNDSFSSGAVPFIIAIDSSRSMNFSSRIKLAKDFSDMLLKKLYLMRSRVALLTFSGQQSKLVMNFSRNFTSLRNHINNIKSEGKTPLYDALKEIYNLSTFEKFRTISLLISDGRGNVFPGNPQNDLEDISRKIKKVSKMYIIDKNDNRFLPTYNNIISEYSGATIINDLKNISIN
jgi:magnesium chelatase subunit D